MKKVLLASALALGIVGCSPSTDIKTNDFVLPNDLKSCEVIRLKSSMHHYIYLIKCADGVPDGYIGTSYTIPKGKINEYGTTILVD